MKHIKTFEKVDKVKDLRKLFNHLVDVFSEYYGYNVNKYPYGYEVLFYNTVPTFMFSIKVSSMNGRFITISRNETDGICSYVLDYFKTLKGVEIFEDGKWRLILDITDKNIDNIINQISNDDFDIKFQSSNYNL